MAKQLNVNLAFTADTSKAKAQIKSLQDQLSSIINMPTTGMADGMAEKLREAGRAAAELKVHLQNATNSTTGNLDFSKLNQSVKNSGMTIDQYAAKIKQIGPEGQKAFTLLAQSVANAEVPIRRSNKVLTDLWTTMKNTARWQLTSSVLHGFMGAVQTAYGYAQDLNESLNNIRIVSGQSVDEMADFAVEANKAAKSLSTSTTRYTNAALIYYQQGLDPKQVKERTDITVKMANVSRQSAEIVSDQMTAVWNNFDDGTQSLEHYADAMVRLGADTASSSDEIAQGLEKFAATADMIGLSFDNAAAALATVTATTRQSADVVGTAFKTIFARIQGLKLGETLDDGTTLNKYSQALESVGITIKDQSGALKDMDTILEEMGTVWKTLEADQKAALAQTVAGVRQYNQLVSLMENFDFYQQNIQSAQNADGALDKQSEIYAESWEAASNRVRAAMEGLYDSIIDDKGFITILNITEKAINGVEGLVDSIGGMGGVITTVGAIFTRVFRQQIATSLNDAAYGLMSWTEKGRNKIAQEQADINAQLGQLANTSDENSPDAVRNKVLQQQLKNQQILIANAKDLSAKEQEIAKILLEQLKIRGDLAVKAAEEVEKAKQDLIASEDALFEGSHRLKRYNKNSEEKRLQSTRLNLLYERAEEAAKLKEKLGDMSIQDAYNSADEDMNKTAADLDDLNDKIETLIQTLSEGDEKLAQKLRDVVKHKERVYKTTNESKKSTEEATAALEFENGQAKINSQEKEKNAQSTSKAAQAEDQLGNEIKDTSNNLNQQNEELDKNVKKKKGLTTENWAKNFTNASSSIFSATSALQAFSSGVDSLKNSDGLGSIVQSLLSFGSAGFMTKQTLDGLSKIMVNNTQNLGQLASTSGPAAKIIGKLAPAAGGSAQALLGLGIYAIAAIAAIKLLEAGIKELIDNYNDHANAVKESQKAVEEATTSFEEASQALNDLKSSLEEYDKFQDTFNNLTQGTKEWNKTLEESNNHIMQMLRDFPELAQYLRNEGGRLTLTNTEAVQNAYANKEREAQDVLNTARITLNVAENRSAITNQYRDKKYQRYGSNADFQQAYGIINEAYSEKGEAIFANATEFYKLFNGTGLQLVASALWSNIESTEELTRELNLNTTQTEALAIANAKNKLENDKFYNKLDSEQDKALLEVLQGKRVASALNDKTSEEYAKIYSKAKAEFDVGMGDYSYYMEQQYGPNWRETYKVTNRGGDDAWVKQLVDGKWEKVANISDTAVLDSMVSHMIQESTDEADQNTVEQLQALRAAYGATGKIEQAKIQQVLYDLVNGGATTLESFTKEEKEKLSKVIESGAVEGLDDSYKAALEAAINAWTEKDHSAYLLEQERLEKSQINLDDRYYAQTKALEQQERVLKRIQKIKENSYGDAHVKAIQKEINATQDEYRLMEQMHQSQKDWLAFDTEELLRAFPMADITNGYIANIAEIKRTTSDEAKLALIENYEETWKAFQDMEDKIIEESSKIKDLEFEKIDYQLEFNLKIEDREIKKLEYKLSKLENNIYTAPERLNTRLGIVTQSKDKYTSYEQAKTELDTKYRSGEIETPDYIAELEKIEAGIYNELNALNELEKSLKSVYGETLAEANEEIEKYTSLMDNAQDVLGHYLDLMEITGKSKNYEGLNKILHGQLEIARQEMEVTKAAYEEYVKQKAELQKEYDALKDKDSDLGKTYKKSLEDAEKNTQETYNKLLEDTKNYLTTTKAEIENFINSYNDTLEKLLTGDSTFDILMDNFDKLNTRQEEYLTETNKIYEINKLMRTASKALDETDNKVAKQKLNNFIQETKGLQQNTQLSKYELEIQQAKYDLLLAQIALEDAQNAKSTVRLRRDSEGNFGYVYTADSEKVNDAQQNVEDKENALYNKSLEGQQEYTQKYLQAQQQMYNELVEAQEQYFNGEFASREDYEKRVEEITNHYYGENGILRTYSNLYNIAIQTDTSATRDNWQKAYGAMTQNTDEWKKKVTEYLGNVSEQMGLWATASEIANEIVYGAFGDSESAIKNFTDQAKEAYKVLMGDPETGTQGLIEVIGTKLKGALEGIPNYFDNQSLSISTLRGEYEDLIDTIQIYNDLQDDISEIKNYGYEIIDKRTGEVVDQVYQGFSSSQEATQRGSDYAKSIFEDQKDDWGLSEGKYDDYYQVNLLKGGKPKIIKSEPEVQIEGGPQTQTDNESSWYYNGTELFYNNKKYNADTLADEFGTHNALSKSKDMNIATGYYDGRDQIGIFGEKYIKENGYWYKVSELTPDPSKHAPWYYIAKGQIGYTFPEDMINWLKEWYAKSLTPNNYIPNTTYINPLLFDTGGYTGAWGPEGKLAMLHEKELVLNKEDTPNLLKTVGFIREIVSAIDSRASMSGLFNLFASTSQLPITNERLEQNVTIHAEFPNAVDHNEIEEAFGNILNTASQYANKKF